MRLVTPSTVLRTVMPRRPPNRDLRTREHLTEAEVERLMEAAKGKTATATGTPPWSSWLTGTIDRPSLGSRWTSERPPCTSVGSRRAHPARIRSWATSCAPSDGSSANRSLDHLSSSRRSVARRLLPLGLPACWSGLAQWPSCPLRRTRTCFVTPARVCTGHRGHDTRALQAYLGHRNIQHTVRYTELSPRDLGISGVILIFRLD